MNIKFRCQIFINKWMASLVTCHILLVWISVLITANESSVYHQKYHINNNNSSNYLQIRRDSCNCSEPRHQCRRRRSGRAPTSTRPSSSGTDFRCIRLCSSTNKCCSRNQSIGGGGDGGGWLAKKGRIQSFDGPFAFQGWSNGQGRHWKMKWQ